MAAQQVGPWSVSGCAPEGVVDGLGFALSCAAVLVNTSPRPVEISAQVDQSMPMMGIDQQAGMTIPAPVRGIVQPMGSVTLAAPPTGYYWVVAYASRRSLLEWGIVAAGALTVLAGLTGLGLYDVWKMVAERHRRKRRRS